MKPLPTPPEQPKPNRLVYGWAIAALLMLAGYVAHADRALFWDERLHMMRAWALPHATSFRQWLLDNDTSAPGPVYALMHYALSGGRGSLGVPAARFVNLAILVLTIGVMAATLRRCRVHGASSLVWLAVPPIWVLYGLALTEPIAMLGLVIGMYGAVLLSNALPASRNEWIAFALVVFGVALATASRQPLLTALPGLIALAWATVRQRTLALVATMLGLVPLVYLVRVWGGLTPPRVAYIGAGHLRLDHAALAFAVVGAFAIFLAPALFWKARRITLPTAVLAIAANGLFGFVRPTLFTSAQRFVGHPTFTRAVEFVAAAGIVAAGAALAALLIAAFFRGDQVARGAAIGVLGLCGGCAAITGLFSSRYATCALPLLVLFLGAWIDLGKWAVVRFTVGSLAGLVALHSYFVYA